MFVVLIAVGLLIVGLAATRRAQDAVAMGALTVVLLGGVITPEQALAGFANAAVATIALLFVVSAGIEESGLSAQITHQLARVRSGAASRALLLLLSSTASAVVANTAIVAALAPVAHGLARRGLVPRAQLFMPLSFSAILGGLCTQVGTSSTLVVTSVLSRSSPETEFGFFTISSVGLPVAVLGLAYLLVAAPKLLRRQDDPESADVKRGIAELVVPPGAPLAGQTIGQAGLRHLPGLFLSRIYRGSVALLAVNADEVLLPNDRLTFVGDTSEIPRIASRHGLTLAETTDGPDVELLEVVVRPGSSLAGENVRDARFRTRYGAVIVSVYRGNKQLTGRLGDIQLHVADRLLVEPGPDFGARAAGQRDFYLLDRDRELGNGKAWLALAILVTMIVLLIVNVLPLVTVVMLAAGGMIVGRCCSLSRARQAIDWQVLIVLGGSLGIGAAIEQTGIAARAASLLAGAGFTANWQLIAALYALTVLLTSFISNGAAAAVMTPLGIQLATGAGLDVRAAAITIAVACSADFITPIGYQTNLMVLGPGGYGWRDYLVFGSPLLVLTGATCVTLTSLLF